MRRAARTTVAFWITIGCPIASLALGYAIRGDDNWLARMMVGYPIFGVIVVATAIGPLIVIWFLYRRWDRSKVDRK
jgi:hypothetical protein